MKPKKKQQGIRMVDKNLVKENNVEKNVLTELSKEIRPNKNK